LVGGEWRSQSTGAGIERHDVKLVVDRGQRIERQLFRNRAHRKSGIKCVLRSERNHEHQQLGLRRDFNSEFERDFRNERNGERGLVELGFGSGFKRYFRNERQCERERLRLRLRLRLRIGVDFDIEQFFRNGRQLEHQLIGLRFGTGLNCFVRNER
jgi:hypothetical protein